MKMRGQVVFLGIVSGGLAAGLALGSVAFLGTEIGAAAGVGLAAGMGALGTWIAVSQTVRQVSRRLVAMTVSQDASGNPLGWAEIDRCLDEWEGTLAEAARARAELRDLSDWTRKLASVEGPGQAPPRRTDPRALVESYRRAAGETARDIEALGKSVERMAAGAEEQTAAIARTASTVEALSDRIDRISQNAEEGAGASQRTREEARRGLEQIQDIIGGMDRLSAHVEGNSRKARRLGDRSQEIGTIVELIAGLSSRTDMLALNATIESVRAGEHGRGFAVVAEEIRKLAERAAVATREVGSLVETIRGDVQESIRALADEQEEVEQESQRVREAGAALERISQFAERSAHLVEGISHSANDQVLATQELVRAIQRISETSDLIRSESTQLRAVTRALSGRSIPMASSDEPRLSFPADQPAGTRLTGAPRVSRPEPVEVQG
jgi:twitching motility protein PilJ